MLQHIDFDHLQAEVGDWSDENFGDQSAALPLLGVGEEIGELTTSVLKREQGIADNEKYAERDTIGDEAERDALADIAIYLADFAYRSHLEVTDTYTDYEWRDDDAVDPVDSIMRMYDAMGTIVRMHVLGDRIGVELDVVELLLELDRFAQLRGFDSAQLIDDTWNGEVIHREWDASIAE